MSAHPNDPAGPDLSPWDSALSARVQPVLSALFHDIMGPLTLIKNRTYLIRRHVHGLATDPSVSPEVRERVYALMALLDGVDDATHRIHRGMAIPRDAVWESVLEGTEFLPEDIIVQIYEAMKGNEQVRAVVPLRSPTQL